MRVSRWLLIPVVVGVFYIGYHHFIATGPTVDPDAVAAMINADWCDSSGYYVESQITGSKQTIYDCVIGSKQRCVTVNGGIASDSTATVRLLFTDTLGASKPSCIA